MKTIEILDAGFYERKWLAILLFFLGANIMLLIRCNWYIIYI